jgi:hypothetical protein
MAVVSIAVDVHEDAIQAEVTGQVVIQSAGVAGAVVAPVTDEDAGHGRTLASDATEPRSMSMRR